jgi:hypothetical protein
MEWEDCLSLNKKSYTPMHNQRTRVCAKTLQSGASLYHRCFTKMAKTPTYTQKQPQ